MLDLAQLLQIPHVDPLIDISPDNSKLAFAWNKTGEWQIYETSLPFRAERSDSEVEAGRWARGEGDITQLTSGPGGKFNPRYSPDGKKLAYALDPDGSESYHLVLYDFESQRHNDLTPNISHALQPNFCWSPDGSQLAFLNDEKGHFRAYIISSNGGTSQLVLDTGHPAWQVEWSSDGKHLAVSCEMHGQDYGVFIVNLETNQVNEICHPERQRRVSSTNEEILRPYGSQNDMLNAHEPKWSPDGSKLAFHSDKHGWFDIGVYDFSTSKIDWITKSDGDSQTPKFMGANIAYIQSKGAVNWIEIHGKQGETKQYQIGKGIHNGIRLVLSKVEGLTSDLKPSRMPSGKG